MSLFPSTQVFEPGHGCNLCPLRQFVYWVRELVSGHIVVPIDIFHHALHHLEEHTLESFVTDHVTDDEEDSN